MESIIKGSGILGGKGKDPTVVNPERYKQRFIDAMDRYFLTVPDRWEGLSKVWDPPKKHNTQVHTHKHVS